MIDDVVEWKVNRIHISQPPLTTVHWLETYALINLCLCNMETKEN